MASSEDSWNRSLEELGSRLRAVEESQPRRSLDELGSRLRAVEESVAAVGRLRPWQAQVDARLAQLDHGLEGRVLQSVERTLGTAVHMRDQLEGDNRVADRLEDQERRMSQTLSQLQMLNQSLEERAVEPTQEALIQLLVQHKRIENLEEQQKSFAIFARRQILQWREWHQEHEQSKFLSVVEDGHTIEGIVDEKLADQDRRMTRLISMVQVLAEQMPEDMEKKMLEGSSSGEVPQLRAQVQAHQQLLHGMNEKFDDMEVQLACANSSFRGSVAITDAASAVGVVNASVEPEPIPDVSLRLDALQEASDHQKFTIWQVANQLPELAETVKQLSGQFQGNFSKVKEHEAYLGFFRSELDAQKQRLHDMSANVDQRLERGFAVLNSTGVVEPRKESSFSPGISAPLLDLSSLTQPMA